MKEKFFNLLVLFLMVLSCVLSSCDINIYSTKYNNMEVSSIVSIWTEGFAPFYREFVRTFDFEKGEIVDNCVTDERNVDENDKNIEIYNNPIVVSTFNKKDGSKLLKKIKFLGFYTWEEKYITEDIICDGGSKYITIYFTNSEVKSTYIYFKYPKNYKSIVNAFNDYLGQDLYY